MLRIQLFGELAAALDGEPLDLPASRKACGLLAWLAVHPGQHGRSRLAAAFWPDVPDSSARASLRSAVWAVRAALGDAAALLVTTRDTVELRGPVVDVHEFDALVAAGRFADAERLCREELLHRFDAEWVFDLREEYDGRRADVLARLAGLAEADDDLAAARKWANRWATLRPLDEAAARTTIRLMLAEGERAAAVAAYRGLAARLRAELDVDPAPQTSALVFGEEPAVVELEHPVTVRHGLVGRDRELARLVAVWRRAEEGAGRTVALSGDGGVGKSRLATEVCEHAAERGALVAAGATTGFGPAVPFGPWLELVDGLVARVGPLPRDAGWAHALNRVVRAPSRRPAGATEPDFDRVRFFDAVVELLAWAARRRPLALLIEDLQHADSSSLELTAYAGRRLARLPVLLLLTRRRLPPRPDLEGVLGALRARGALAADLELAPLPPAAIRRLVAGPAGPMAERIVAIAGGNPLIALETAADPEAGLRGATRAALSRLRGPARLFVEFVATAGRDLDRMEVAALPLAGDPARAIAEALGAGLLRADGDALGFRHALLSDAVYRDLADPLRVRLHGELAAALRKRAPRRLAAEIARHLRRAGRDDQAVVHLLTAATRARAVSALPEAAAFLIEATELEPDDPDAWVELAEVQAWRGLLTGSDAAFDAALARIPRADTAAHAGAWLRRGRWLRGGICHPRESRRSYRAALDVLDSDPADPLARVEALAGLAWTESVSGDPAAAEALLAQAETGAGDGDLHGDLLAHDIEDARGHTLLRAGRFTDSVTPLTAAAAAAQRAGRPDMAYSCLANAAAAAAFAGDLGRALDFTERCLPLVVPTGLLRLGVYAHSARACVLRRLGRFEESRQACDHAATLADRVGLVELEAMVRHDRGMLAHAIGDWTEAARELGFAVNAGTLVSLPLARLHRADALARAGLADEAETELPSGALPTALVARRSAVQARIAAARGDTTLARERFHESERAWRRCRERAGDPGAEYVAALVALGRSPISVFVEPDRELAAVSAELDDTRAVRRAM